MRAACLLALLALASASAQDAPPLPDTTAARFGSSQAVVFLLTESGFGLGGALRARLSDDVSLVVEGSLGAGRDEREQTFVGLLGERTTPFKRNYVAMVPLHVGVEARLFRASVEDNFRPFVAVAAGPTLAVQWPYFDDANGNGRLDPASGEGLLGLFGGVGDGAARVGVGGELTLGAFFGRGRRTARAVRFGFRATYFPAEIDLLEIRPEEVQDPSRKLFVTPVVSFHLAQLL